MGNPFFNRFGGQQMQPQSPFSNIQDLQQKFNAFKSQFQGDPQQQVQNLLDSGQMSQEQFNQLSNMAKTFSGLFK